MFRILSTAADHALQSSDAPHSALSISKGRAPTEGRKLPHQVVITSGQNSAGQAGQDVMDPLQTTMQKLPRLLSPVRSSTSKPVHQSARASLQNICHDATGMQGCVPTMTTCMGLCLSFICSHGSSEIVAQCSIFAWVPGRMHEIPEHFNHLMTLAETLTHFQ